MVTTTSVLNKAESPVAGETASTAKTSIDPPVTTVDDPLKSDKCNSFANQSNNSHTDSSNDNNITTINTANTLNGVAKEVDADDTGGAGDGDGDKSRELLEQSVKLLPKASPPPQIIVIPASAAVQSSVVANSAAKKIRRAFSMPRNPFRWSHKLKTSGTHDSGGGNGGGGGGVLSIGKSYTLSSCVGGNRERSGSFVSLNSNEGGGAITTTSANVSSQDTKMPTKSNDKQNADGANGIRKPKAKSNTLNGGVANGQNNNDPASVSANTAGNNNAANGTNRLFRRSSFRKFLNRITQHMTNTVS